MSSTDAVLIKLLNAGKTAALEQTLGHLFKNRALLVEALTHPSHGYELRQQVADNQRLEFLGDAVLQLAITEALYHHLQNEHEGALTTLRAQLVNRQQLVAIAETIRVGELLILGRGEEKNEGRARASNLADAMEALIGAAFLDGGWEAARAVVIRLWEPVIARAASTSAGIANPKGALQEHLQVHGGEPPEYVCTAEEGPPHARRFVVEVSWNGKVLGSGEGASKKEAEAAAAADTLKQLQKNT